MAHIKELTFIDEKYNDSIFKSGWINLFNTNTINLTILCSSDCILYICWNWDLLEDIEWIEKKDIKAGIICNIFSLVRSKYMAIRIEKIKWPARLEMSTFYNK